MHRCFQSPSTLRLICDQVHNIYQLEATYDHLGRNSQLFTLAQTCRQFREPALTKLWETIYHPETIIKCLGKDVWTVKTEKRGYTNFQVLHLTRATSPSDIEIMKKYGLFVRHLGECEVTHKYSYGMASEVWQALRTAFADTLLFPNLRHVYLDEETMKESLGIFGTKNLISISTSEPFEPLLLGAFSACCPDITTLDLQVEINEHAEGEGVITALNNWRHLSRFTSAYANPGMLQAIAGSSSSLRRLRLGTVFAFLGNFSAPSPPEGNDPPFFPKLEEIQMGFTQFVYATILMDCIPATGHLRNLALHLPNSEECEERDWLDLIETFKRHSSSLKKLEIADGHDDSGGYDEEYTISLSNAVLVALAADFPTLTHVKIFNIGGYTIVDEDIKQLTEAMPVLEEFRWYSGEEVAETSPFGTTIACLAFFASNCRFLSRLAIEFDASEEDKVPQDLESFNRQGVNLKWLDVYTSPAGDKPKLVASFLSKIFPSLQHLDCMQGRKEVPWARVRRLLKVRKGGMGVGIPLMDM